MTVTYANPRHSVGLDHTSAEALRQRFGCCLHRTEGGVSGVVNRVRATWWPVNQVTRLHVHDCVVWSNPTEWRGLA